MKEAARVSPSLPHADGYYFCKQDFPPHLTV